MFQLRSNGKLCKQVWGEEKQFYTQNEQKMQNKVIGATAHMCCSREIFTNFVERDEEISLAGDKQIAAKEIGGVDI